MTGNRQKKNLSGSLKRVFNPTQKKKDKDPNDFPSITFTGLGFLGIYNVGVATLLKEQAPHLLDRGLAGSSSGGIVAASIACGIDLQTIHDGFLDLADAVQKYRFGIFNPMYYLEDSILNLVLQHCPKNAHVKASGKLHLSLTSVSDFSNKVVNTYETKDELIRALLCCSFVPGVSGITPPLYRGNRYFDGGFSNNIPLKEKGSLTVSSFYGDFDICPKYSGGYIFPIPILQHKLELSKINYKKAMRVMWPPAAEILDEHFYEGYEDAEEFFIDKRI